MHIGRVAATSTDLVKKALALLSKQGGPVRLSEALKLGIHRDTLRVMRDQELLRQVSRGLYLPAKGKALADPDLVIVAKRVRGAVVCLSRFALNLPSQLVTAKPATPHTAANLSLN